ncbi:hypothetical protein LTR35_000170 [Friedmanniomyces endolithicus]|nr:hypothetical protein LTS00_016693 [Friedmanniomyces endolithicus]KAK0293566.1 hypothetical protein LTR35_000170 [Friedmanniomyces endolithicus]KAK0975463.1 hypothetical protein LTR54_016791 [Friedmanniomyces endolithicus]
MSVIGEIVGIVACVAAVVSAYHDGGAIIQKIKVKRAARRAPAPPRLLEESIDQAPEEIEREKRRGIQRFGKAFEEGDHIAVIALQHITIQLQGSLLEKLRSDENENTDFLYLVDAADAGRDRTIGALLELRQRLLAAQPIVEIQPQFPLQPRQIQASLQTYDIPIRLPQQPLPSPAPVQVQRALRTWSRDQGASREIPREEDTNPGADDQSGTGRRKRHGSLLGFFKHHRSHSGSKDDLPKVDETLHSSTSPNNTPSIGAPEREIVREQAPIPQPGFLYQEWEDDPAQIWGAKQDSERRNTVASNAPIAPDDGQLSPVMTNRALSVPASRSQLFSASYSGSIAVPTPTPENEYLGFCKSAWRLQNGDRKAVARCKEFNDGWSQSSVHYLACSSSKCAFAGHINVDQIWDKVWTVDSKGLKFRWSFLAKSHVPQQKVKNHEYAYQCLFCVFLGAEKSPVYFGTDTYLDHVSSSHRGQITSEVVLYKTKGVVDRIASDQEDFDMNLFPLDAQEQGKRRMSAVLSDDLLKMPDPSEMDDAARDSVHSNEPWNEGLSEFQWDGDMKPAELA